MKQPMIVDYETEGIVGNTTVRPPEPVGVSIKNPGFKSRYFAWGHPSGNNCESPSTPKGIIAEAIAQKRPILFHNSKFDVAVMEHWWGIKPDLVEDTMFQIFLADPHADTFSLKPSSERILGIKPEEQDHLRNWILSHVPGATSKEWGAHIAKAPASIVAPYANGDVDRTWLLHQHLRDKIEDAPYKREIALLPLVMAGERHGVRLDLERLGNDLRAYEKTLTRIDGAIHKLLGNFNVNLDSGEELANALDAAKMVKQWILTPTGRRSTARANIESAITHPQMVGLLQYRGALAHCLSNFARPWLELGQDYGGRLHPDWNQVRQARGADIKGTRTGRLSCGKPNFQNPPNEYSVAIPEGYPDLPIMRKYLLPDEGHVWLKRDYSQQELRIMSSYSEGRLYQRYQENPRIDAHEETGAIIKELVGLDLPRKHVKITGFSMIYGAGVPGLAGQLGVPIEEAATVRGAYFAAMPEVKELMEDCKARGRRNEPITTWGGRHYYVEPPKIIAGRHRTFEYKLLNYLIQGSAADQTKEALIRWWGTRGDAVFLATVHDEINICAPKGTSKKGMAALRKAMESLEFDVKMLSDGFVGTSWGDLKECE